MKNAKAWAVLAAVIVLATSCTSTRYTARSGYVGFTEDGAVTVQQMKKTSLGEDTLYPTFDDEFEYDENGNVMKHIQTKYFDNGEKYDEWVVEYQKIGETTLPKSVSINGIVYLEVEYEILESDHEGKIYPLAGTPNFVQNNGGNFLMALFVGSQPIIEWDLDLENFEVPFRNDNRFVTKEESFGIYTGLSVDKVLSLGYDNIVIKKFYYSYDKFNYGFNLSIADSQPGMMKGDGEMKDEYNVSFVYDWNVAGGKIIQNGMTFTRNHPKGYMKFFTEREFDSTGRRTSEIWKLNDSVTYVEEPVVLFQQTLTY
ncbi:hypothetical protein [Spirochaeta isovalerica]|uniref:Lipoprotein n=1 Tax=Spirochaeta isovalerica TaxID=150 RepID=A0A841RBJ0_9SPIO|nr:hypothetical protein [Spirochaeta isovalerica]MBB6480380.1 hypothetical protein [Spirochaeta isovalerica]